MSDKFANVSDDKLQEKISDIKDASIQISQHKETVVEDSVDVLLAKISRNKWQEKNAERLDKVFFWATLCLVIIGVLTSLVIVLQYTLPLKWRWLDVDELKEIKAMVGTVFIGYFAGTFKKIINK